METLIRCGYRETIIDWQRYVRNAWKILETIRENIVPKKKKEAMIIVTNNFANDGQRLLEKSDTDKIVKIV